MKQAIKARIIKIYGDVSIYGALKIHQQLLELVILWMHYIL
jgi:hypothetical protein